MSREDAAAVWRDPPTDVESDKSLARNAIEEIEVALPDALDVAVCGVLYVTEAQDLEVEAVVDRVRFVMMQWRRRRRGR